MKLYAPEDYSGRLMSFEEAVDLAEETGCRVICVYREPSLDDINVADLTGDVIDWVDDYLREDDKLSWDEGGPSLSCAGDGAGDDDSRETVAATNALHDAIMGLLKASLDLSEAAWQHERDIWLSEWPGRCGSLWRTRCDVAPVGPSWHPAQRRARRTCRFERHGNPNRPMPDCRVSP